MILDVRGVPYMEIFIQVRDAVNEMNSKLLPADVTVFLDSDESDKCMAVKGVAEVLLDCRAIIREANGYYVVQITREFPGGNDAGRQKTAMKAA